MTAGRPADVSVVIPVRNGAPEIRECIEGILSQTVTPREIIVIDSGSTDGTLDIVAGYPSVTLVRIPPEEFDHGDTRNLGARLAKGQFVLLTVSDARPTSPDWIATMLDGFVDDEVAAVCGSQVVPHERDKNPVEWFRPVSEPRIARYHFRAPSEFDRLSPVEKRNVCGWDDVTAMYRRQVLLDLPFRRTSFAEDMLWAKDAFIRGLVLVYNPAARVYHYHYESPDFAFKRALMSLYNRYRSVGFVPTSPPVVLPILRAIRQLVREPSITWRERAQWGLYNIRNQLAVRSAVSLFLAELAKGERALEALHARHGGRPPIPPKVVRA